MAENGDLGGFREEAAIVTVPDPPRPRDRWRGFTVVLGVVAIFLVGVLIGMYVPRGEENSVGLATSTTRRSTSSTEPFFSTTVATATPSTVVAASAPTTRRSATTTVRRSQSATTAVRPAPTTTTTARPPSERVVGRTSGGGSGTGTSSVSFSVSGAWRIDHTVQGAEASVSVFDQAGGYSFGYTAPVGSGSRNFNRTCTCRVVVSSPEGTYSVTVVDVAG